MPKIGQTTHTIRIIERLPHASHIKCKIAKQICVGTLHSYLYMSISPAIKRYRPTAFCREVKKQY